MERTSLPSCHILQIHALMLSCVFFSVLEKQKAEKQLKKTQHMLTAECGFSSFGIEMETSSTGGISSTFLEVTPYL